MGDIDPVVVEKTVGDTYSVNWGPTRTFTQSPNGKNYSQEGVGWDETRFNTLKGKSRVTGDVTEIKSAAVALGFDFTGVKIDYDVAAAGRARGAACWRCTRPRARRVRALADSLSCMECFISNTSPRNAVRCLSPIPRTAPLESLEAGAGAQRPS